MLKHLHEFGALNRPVRMTVLHHRFGNVHGFPAAGLPAEAEVHVFVVEEIFGIKATDCREVGGVKRNRCLLYTSDAADE